MSSNERRLLILFCVVGGAILFAKVIYPSTIKPAFEVTGELETTKKKYAIHKKKRGRLDNELEAKYIDYVKRTGGVDVVSVEQDLYDDIFDMTQAAKLREPSITPKNASTDKKTKISTVTFTFSAKGSFAECVEFVRRFYELPYVARLDDLKITPTGSRGNAAHDEARISGEIEALVLPLEPRFGLPKGKRPDKIKKYERSPHQYKKLASRTPLTPWTPYKPPDRGDQGEETKTPLPTPTPKPIAKGPPTDPAARDTVLRMTVKYGVDEAFLVNTKTRRSSYVSVGEELDRGELVLVHSRGVVAHKATPEKDFGYFVYPLGRTLAESVQLEQATDQPEIILAMNRYFKEMAAASPRSAIGDGPKVDGGGGGGPKQIDILDDAPEPDGEVGPPIPETLNEPKVESPQNAATDAEPQNQNPQDKPAVGDAAKSSPSASKKRKDPDWMNREHEKKNRKKKSQPAAGQGVKKGKPAKPAGSNRNALKKKKSRPKTTRPDD